MPLIDEGYIVPAGRHTVEQVIARSRFIATVDRVGTAAAGQTFLHDIRAAYPDATHHCWAYIAGPPGSSNQIGLSDDGEPHGTAGRPMLTVLTHSGIGEIGAVVTRYYGGTKLGTGGLVKAYSGSVQLALATLPRSTRKVCAHFDLTIDYASITIVQQTLAAFEASIDGEQYDAAVCYRVAAPSHRVASLRAAVADATHGEARWTALTEDSA